MRLFFAIPLPPDIAAAAAGALPPLPALRLVRPELMHVTLAFLGVVPDARLDDVVAAANAAGAGRGGFRVSLEELGRFPERGAPRTVWLGIADGRPQLADLALAIRSELDARGLPFDAKPFQPHVTLARVRERAEDDDARRIARAVDGARPSPLRFDATAFAVVESALSTNGPRYTARAAVPLGEGGR